jgi:hypothetical protein
LEPLPPDKGLILHPRHARQAELCFRGGRQWFAAHGLSWQDFLDNGISETRLREIGDPVPFAAIHAAHAEADENGK